ncbi:MAG: RluA family pseudouridine synthase [Anaerolineales bacterium]|nr:RluA family pseudouridine synthase [Anaerolineales bacterium]
MNILHLDEDLLIVEKPSGLSVLPDGWDPEAPYLRRMVEQEYGPVWVVHRLDKGTSGILIFARSPEAHRELNIQFEQHCIKKHYHALLNGNPRWEEHTARHPLRANVGKKHRTMVDNKKGKPSETHFKILERYRDGVLVEASPTTGRTHQVRVHAYALGFPLLADELYSAPPTRLIQRPALHAIQIEFNHPRTEKRMHLNAAPPDDFIRAIAGLRNKPPAK